MDGIQASDLIATLRLRFGKNVARHQGLDWAEVERKLRANPEKLKVLREMERTEGEPDVTGRNEETGEFLFCDCAAESPKGRRSLCYDRAGQLDRKDFVPENNATDMAAAMGIELLDEEQYRALQKLGDFDTKTSSWIRTPRDVRTLGGALFGDRRYDRVFIYHNGASSYYGVRGFRGLARV